MASCYVKIQTVDAQRVLDNYDAWVAKSQEIKVKGIDLYYKIYFTNGNIFTRLMYRKSTPRSFAYSRMSWGGVRSLIDHLLSPEERDTIWYADHISDIYMSDKLRELVNVNTETIRITEDMAKFINAFKGEIK